MYVVLGATGHIGSHVVKELTNLGSKVIAIARTKDKASALSDARLVEGVAVDIGDAGALCSVLKRGERAFLLNPPADPASDTDAEELRTARSIARALEGSNLAKVVVASTYGAQQGDAIGDLSVLWEFERLVEKTGVPTATNRGAYYFANFDQMVEPAKQGVLPAPFPRDFALPMVSPIDLAKAAVARLTSPSDDTGVRFVEGPRRYTMGEVAEAFSRTLGRTVEVQQIPREEIEDSFKSLGFSDPAARAYRRMTEATLDGPEMPAEFTPGKVTLEEHIAALIAKNEAD